MPSKLLYPVAVLAAVLLPYLPSRADVNVVASIPPVHSLVAKVMEGVGEPHLLLQGGQSPHDYALRPSDARQIEKADVIFLVSRELESFLENAAEGEASHARVVELGEVEGVHHLSVREGVIWEPKDGHEEDHSESAHDHDDGKGQEHAHEHGSEDPHVWLSPTNGKAFVSAIAAALAETDPSHKDRYAANAERAIADLDRLTSEIETILAPVKSRPFLVFHDAYQYFEKEFGLTAAGAISLATAAPPGAARLSELRERVAQGGIKCVFQDVQFSPRLAEIVAEGSGVRLGTLDPLGVDIEPGPEAYDALLRGLARGFSSCLD